eukprot:1139176-Pelagomonas_calceolata.AAC.2
MPGSCSHSSVPMARLAVMSVHPPDLRVSELSDPKSAEPCLPLLRSASATAAATPARVVTRGACTLAPLPLTRTPPGASASAAAAASFSCAHEHAWKGKVGAGRECVCVCARARVCVYACAHVLSQPAGPRLLILHALPRRHASRYPQCPGPAGLTATAYGWT